MPCHGRREHFAEYDRAKIIVILIPPEQLTRSRQSLPAQLDAGIRVVLAPGAGVLACAGKGAAKRGSDAGDINGGGDQQQGSAEVGAHGISQLDWDDSRGAVNRYASRKLASGATGTLAAAVAALDNDTTAADACDALISMRRG